MTTFRSMQLICMLLGAPPGVAIAEVLDFEGSLSLVTPGFGQIPFATGAGVATLDSRLPVRSIDLDGFVGGTTVIPVTDPLVSNGGLVAFRMGGEFRAGRISIDPFAPPFSEPRIESALLPLAGELRICLIFTSCNTGIFLPLSESSGTRGLGIGGIITVGGTGTTRFSLVGAPYTIQTATATATTGGGGTATLIASGSIHGPLSFTSSLGQVVASSAGSLSLVTPTRVLSIPGIAGANQFPGFVRFDIRFAPEPGAASAGVPALLLLGLLSERRRVSRSSARRSKQWGSR